MAVITTNLAGILEHQPLFWISIFLSLLILWRVLRFSVIPALYPDEPKELPYWIPCHAWGFFVNSNDVLERGRKTFGNQEIYSITIAGESLCVVTAPRDVGDVYRNTTTLTRDKIVNDMYTWMGISPQSLLKLWNTPSSDKVKSKSPSEMILEYHRNQLHSGEKFEELTAKILIPSLQRKLNWGELKTHSACIQSTADTITFSLWDWCSEVMVNGMTEAYYGKTIFHINPKMLQANMIWDRTSWKYMYKLPRFLAGDMLQAKNEIVGTFETYFKTPNEERSDAIYFVIAAEKELRASGLNDDEIAKVNMLHHWAITGNLYKAIFWMVAYLVHNPTLLNLIREEISPALVDNNLDFNYLIDKCPQLEALFNEMLRLCSGSSLAREVVVPTIIGKKLLRKGTTVLAPSRQFHLAPNIWGPSTHTFDPERFHRDKGLAHNPSFRPFGGGSTFCPGRFMARRTTFAMVALLFTSDDFDVSIDVGGSGKMESEALKFPRLDDTKPGLGIFAPVEGDDVLLVLRRLK